MEIKTKRLVLRQIRDDFKDILKFTDDSLKDVWNYRDDNLIQ